VQIRRDSSSDPEPGRAAVAGRKMRRARSHGLPPRRFAPRNSSRRTMAFHFLETSARAGGATCLARPPGMAGPECVRRSGSRAPNSEALSRGSGLTVGVGGARRRTTALLSGERAARLSRQRAGAHAGNQVRHLGVERLGKPAGSFDGCLTSTPRATGQATSGLHPSRSDRNLFARSRRPAARSL
jgi:hypothetical protein